MEINQQRCEPPQFLYEIIRKWRLIRHGNISVSKEFNTEAMVFTDDGNLRGKHEEYLQYSFPVYS
jgi:hypothetical protein